MDKPENGKFHESARKKFLALSLESTRKSYYPQLKEQLKNAKKNELRMQLLIDNLPAQISYINAEEQFVLVNREFEKAFGRNRETIIGKQMAELLGEDHYQQVKSHIQKALSGTSTRFEFSMPAQKGNTKFYEVNYVAETDSQGQASGFYVMTLDVTDKKKAEQEKLRLETSLRQSHKMEAIGTLAGGIAHDFNNILSGIFGYSQLIELNCHNPEKIKAHNQKIVEGARRATDLIRQILTFSRESKNHRQPLYLYAILKEALKLIRSTIPTNIDIKTDIQSNEKILADATQIHQLIMNLCTNAYHAMGDNGGILTIRLKDTRLTPHQAKKHNIDISTPYLCLDIGDTGPGIPLQIQDRIFDPYFTTKDKEKGTGLGLAIVNGIVKKHEGFIEFDSALGKGAMFHLYFPISAHSKTTPDINETQRSSRNAGITGSIMVVDDEAPIRATLSAILSRQGHKVTTFENGGPALEAFTRHPDQFDLVITDMTMPGITGDRLAVKLMEIRPDIPIIVCTGYHENFHEEEARSLGISKYLQKPIIGSELSGIIQQMLS